jgi:hypothetical protein
MKVLISFICPWINYASELKKKRKLTSSWYLNGRRGVGIIFRGQKFHFEV